MANCKLSIITVNYNNAIGLEKTIKSVLTQSFSDFEYIVIDGDSTDGSKEIIKNYGDKFVYCISEKDNGVYHAMNKGILKSTGEYCYFLNSGDYLVDHTVLNNVFLKSNAEDIIYGNMINGELGRVDLGIKDLTFFDFFKGSIYHQSAFIKRSLFTTIGLYNESFKVVSDWEFFVKAIFLNQCSFKYIDLNIAVYEVGGISFRSHEFNLMERELVLEKYFPLFQKDYRELEKFKLSDFSGIYRKMEQSKVIRHMLRGGLSVSRFIKFRIFRKEF